MSKLADHFRATLVTAMPAGDAKAMAAVMHPGACTCPQATVTGTMSYRYYVVVVVVVHSLRPQAGTGVSRMHDCNPRHANFKLLDDTHGPGFIQVATASGKAVICGGSANTSGTEWQSDSVGVTTSSMTNEPVAGH
jgi:hypothetical protein